MKKYVFLIIILVCLVAFDSLVRAEPPPRTPSKTISDCKKYVLIMLDPDENPDSIKKDLQKAKKLSRDKRHIIYFQEKLQVYSKYKTSGLYPNDGSMIPLWTMNWQYGPEYLIAPDGIHLVIYNDWAESMDNIPIRFFKNGQLIREYEIGELVDFPGIINWGSSDPVSLDMESERIHDNRVILVSGHRERYVFDITTGDIFKSFRPPRWILLGIFVLMVTTVLLFWRTFIKRKQKSMQVRVYRRTCLVIFENFRQNMKIGMTSKQFSEALADSTWIENAFIYPITALSGQIPLEWYSNSICYCINLYPDTDNKSNYAIWFRILKPEENTGSDEIENMGIKFLKGELIDETVKLQEFTLCTYKTEEFEFFPPKEEGEASSNPSKAGE